VSLRQQLSYARALIGILHGEKAFGGPVRANLMLTNRCNMRCIHCYFYSPYLDLPMLSPLRRTKLENKAFDDPHCLRALQRVDADTSLIRKFASDLFRLGTVRFELSGQGELLLHRDAIEIMGFMKHAGVYCTANTNGTLLNREIVDELIRIGFDELRITTMAGTPGLYVHTHPGSQETIFFKLRDNLLYLNERKMERGVRKPEVTLVFVVIAQNCDGIMDFARFAARVGADRVLFRPVDDLEDAGLAKVVPTDTQSELVRGQLAETRTFLKSRGIRHNIDNFQRVFRTQLDTSELYRRIPCYIGWLSVEVGPDGEIYPCCRCYEPLGNINEQSFQEIWNGQGYSRFRKEAVHRHTSRKLVRGCGCNSCVHHTANLRVYRYLHPFKGRSADLDLLSEGCLASRNHGNRE
jgi:radical SAM protein with 4Fe4S-binding SPASM domain